MNSFALCELCQDNGPFYICFTACDTCVVNYCVSCWNKWIVTCLQDSGSYPKCPHCRTRLDEATIEHFLGMKLHDYSKLVEEEEEEEEDQVPTITQSSSSNDEESSTDMIASLARILDLQRCPCCQVCVQRDLEYAIMACWNCGIWFCPQCGQTTCQCVQQVEAQDDDNYLMSLPEQGLVPNDDTTTETSTATTRSTPTTPNPPMQASRVHNFFRNYWSKRENSKQSRGRHA